MKTKLTGRDYCAMIEGGASAIALEKKLINDLNVFPVPDGDTGTNMTLTMGAGAAEVKKHDPKTIAQASSVVANALLRGARGNSGVILSLLFRGISKGLKDIEEADALQFALAMETGVEAAYKAVMKPAEGTMLTVSRVASAAAVEFAESENDIEKLFEHTIQVGLKAVEETIDQNPVLKKAGVVDSGGKGYVMILEGMLRALRGEVIETPANEKEEESSADFASFSEEDITFTYCTEFIIVRENRKDAELLRNLLDTMGDSLVVVDDDALIKVHVHTDDPGRVLTEALAYGGLTGIKIENMREQHAEAAGHKTAAPAPAPVPAEPKVASPEKAIGFVVVSAGEGLDLVFSDLGADQIVTGGQTMNPSTADLAEAIDLVAAETVFVLPNNKNIILAAQQAIPLTHKRVIVIPTTTCPQGVSALLAIDPEMSVSDMEAVMTEAMSRVKTAQITYASRDSDFDGHAIRAGQYLTLLDNKILGSADDFASVLDTTVGALAELAPEFVNVFYGEGVDEAMAQATADIISERLPGAEITLIQGGQPVYSYMISAE